MRHVTWSCPGAGPIRGNSDRAEKQSSTISNRSPGAGLAAALTDIDPPSGLEYSTIRADMEALSRLDAVFRGATNVFWSGDDGEFLQACNFLRVDQIWSAVKNIQSLIGGAGQQAAGRRLPLVCSLALSGSVVNESLRAAIKSSLTENLLIVYGCNEILVATVATPAIRTDIRARWAGHCRMCRSRLPAPMGAPCRPRQAGKSVFAHPP